MTINDECTLAFWKGVEIGEMIATQIDDYEDLYVDYFAERVTVREVIEPTMFINEEGNRIFAQGCATLRSVWRAREHTGESCCRPS